MSAKQVIVAPGGSRHHWPWKNGQRAVFPKTGEEVTLRRVEPPTLGITYQFVHRSLDLVTLRHYRWRGRAWSLARLRQMIERGELRMLAPGRRSRRSRTTR
jgi:hypothetical protein